MSDLELDEFLWDRLVAPQGAWSALWLAEMSPMVRAYVATTTFELTVGNGGLTQLFENWEGRPWLVEAAIEGYRHLGLGEVAQVITEQVLPIANAETEKQRRELVRRGVPPRLMQDSALNALDDLIGDHTALRIRLVRANPVAFGLSQASNS